MRIDARLRGVDLVNLLTLLLHDELDLFSHLQALDGLIWVNGQAVVCDYQLCTLHGGRNHVLDVASHLLLVVFIVIHGDGGRGLDDNHVLVLLKCRFILLVLNGVLIEQALIAAWLVLLGHWRVEFSLPDCNLHVGFCLGSLLRWVKVVNLGLCSIFMVIREALE